MLVSRCSHVWCKYCILLVFFRRWGRMISHTWPVDLIAWRRLAVCSGNVAIYITRDYILRQTKNLTLIVSHNDEYPQPILRKKKNIRENKRAKQKKKQKQNKSNSTKNNERKLIIIIIYQKQQTSFVSLSWQATSTLTKLA